MMTALSFSRFHLFFDVITSGGFFQLMLDMWNEGIFANIKDRLQVSAMKIVLSERRGEAFDTQLVIGVRESYGTYILMKNK